LFLRRLHLNSTTQSAVAFMDVVFGQSRLWIASKVFQLTTFQTSSQVYQEQLRVISQIRGLFTNRGNNLYSFHCRNHLQFGGTSSSISSAAQPFRKSSTEETQDTGAYKTRFASDRSHTRNLRPPRRTRHILPSWLNYAHRHCHSRLG